MWNEAMCAIINPLGIPSTALPTIEDVVSEDGNNDSATVGGSYYLCINPAKFGPINAVKNRSDKYVRNILDCPPRPGHSVRVPGAQGYKYLRDGIEEIDILTNHWDPFFVNIAGRYGLSEDKLRQEFKESKAPS